MKIAIPTVAGKLTLHFGHCQEFAILDVENGAVTSKEFLTPPPHEPGVLPRWLHDQGADVVIAGGMGHRAIDLFQQAGIEVITGAPVEEPEVLAKSYLAGTLQTGDNACAGGHGDSECGGH